ncbi:restriction endonuclease subunit S [Vibrio cyclitrophicus]
MSWPLVSLSSIAEVVTGNTPSKADESFFGGDIPFVSPSELDLGYVSSSKQTLTAKGASVSRLIPADSVMVCCIGSLGKVGISSIPVVTNQQINSLVVNQEVACPLYVYYFCKTLKNTLNDMAPKTTVAIVNKTKFSALKIPLPPLETQKQIATVLEKADQLRKDCQQMEQELNSLAQSVFIDMFGDPVTNPRGWDKCSIGDITSKVTDGEHQTPKRTGSGYKLLSARNIQHGHLDVVNEKVDYVGEDEFKRITKRLVIEKSDVLLSCSGTIGRAALNTLDEPFCLVRSAAVIRLLQEFMLPEFLVGYLGTSYMQAVMHHEANSSGQPNLFQNQIKKLKVYTPPIELQEGFKVFLEHQKIELLNLKYLKSEYDEVFNSLMQKAFKGELNL